MGSAEDFNTALSEKVAPSVVPGLTACLDGEDFCKTQLYAGDMPSRHPALIDTIPMLNHLPNAAQSVLPMASPANSVHATDIWKCDSKIIDFTNPMMDAELLNAYVHSGNSVPYCVPIPVAAGDTTSSLWMNLGYFLKKMEQAHWAVFYSSSFALLAEYLAADAFYLWSYAS